MARIYTLLKEQTIKKLIIPGTKIEKDHQVDIHIYINDIFIAVIECKSYLESCYLIEHVMTLNYLINLGMI